MDADDFVIQVCELLRSWINHSKEGYRRSEERLIEFNKLWYWTRNFIRELEKKEELMEEELEFIRHVKYVGVLRRVHKKYNHNLESYGIEETPYYVSWTKSSNVEDIYWVYDTTDCIIITAEATNRFFGIDLVGYSEYLQKYAYPDYRLGSPAILKEQEVVFPILSETFKSIEQKNIR